MARAPGWIKRDKEESDALTRQTYLGPRDERFRSFIKLLLGKTGLKEATIELILKEEMPTYEKVFTHRSISEVDNYEYYEWMGDQICTVTVCKYLREKFPQYQKASGVKLFSRLKINFVSKKYFSGFGQKLGFLDYISSDLLTRLSTPDSLLEDVFEAFVGATDIIFDRLVKDNAGYTPIAIFMKPLLDSCPISVGYEDLYDAKTRLKELSEYINNQTFRYKRLASDPRSFTDQNFRIGVDATIPTYQVKVNGVMTDLYSLEKAHRYDPKVEVKYITKQWAIGHGYTVKEAEQDAAQKTIDALREVGIINYAVRKGLDTL